MRIVSGKIYALQIPFVEAFAHATKNRAFSDSFVVKLIGEDGTVGYGEGAARPYVTGETVETSIKYIKDRLFSAISETEFAEIESGIEPLNAFAKIEAAFPAQNSLNGMIPNAAKAAVELALIDCRLKSQKLALGAILPPKRIFVTYSGVITAGTTETAVQHAKKFKFFGIKRLKIKIGDDKSVERVAAVRKAVGDEFSLRVDANGCYSVDSANEISNQLSSLKIDSFEQPVPRGKMLELCNVYQNPPIPFMADESLVTLKDAHEFGTKCGYFNLRISKCGGIINTLKIAKIAQQAGVKIQLGCQVGETAILSAAGRHVAAHLEECAFVEGSYGNLLLTEDVARESIKFGHGGRAPLLRRHGLGIEVSEKILEKYAVSVIDLGKEAAKNA